MGDVVYLPRGIVHRGCPTEGCGYVELQDLIQQMRIDPLCPRCKKARLSEFVPIHIGKPKHRPIK